MNETTIALNHDCWFHINHDDRIVSTGFPDGSILHAAAETTDENVARALALGYGCRMFAEALPEEDRTLHDEMVWLMTQEHDLMHMRLAQAEGLPFSRTLHGVATANPVSEEEALLEERRVFLMTRLMNIGAEALHEG